MWNSEASAASNFQSERSADGKPAAAITDGTEETDDEVKFRQRKSNILRKSKSKKFKGLQRKLDARQYAAAAGVVFLTSWGLAVTFLLLNLGILYNFTTVPATREDYSIKGAAEWAKRQASEDLMQGVKVWDIINASIEGLVYRAPTDYTNLGNVLQPVFDTMPVLQAIEFAFSDRASQVSLTRRKGTIVRGPSSHMQASSADCFLMGVEGCVAQPLTMAVQDAPRPQWYTFGMYSLRTTAYGGVFSWSDAPEVVVESAPDGGDDLWPAIRLVFKLSFPTFRDPDGAYTTVIGRITVKLSSLVGSRLADERLGSDGKIFLCDAGGVVLASQNVFDVLAVVDGQVRFRYIWEGGYAWANSISSAFTGSSVTEMKKEVDRTFVAVEPLEYPLERFGIVVVAPSREPFQNVALVGTSALASVVAPAPYAIAGAVAGLFVIGQCFATMRKNDGKVGVEAYDNKRHSITETMSRPVSGKNPRRNTFRDKLRRATTMFHVRSS